MDVFDDMLDGWPSMLDGRAVVSRDGFAAGAAGRVMDVCVCVCSRVTGARDGVQRET